MRTRLGPRGKVVLRLPETQTRRRSVIPRRAGPWYLAETSRMATSALPIAASITFSQTRNDGAVSDSAFVRHRDLSLAPVLRSTQLAACNRETARSDLCWPMLWKPV